LERDGGRGEKGFLKSFVYFKLARLVVFPSVPLLILLILMSKCPGCTVSDISKTLLAYVNTGIRWREDYRLKAKLLFPLVLVLMMIKHWDYGIDEVMVQCICSKEAM
jgi:hypothetical protein